jgi:hypothetical protein
MQFKKRVALWSLGVVLLCEIAFSVLLSGSPCTLLDTRVSGFSLADAVAELARPCAVSWRVLAVRALDFVAFPAALTALAWSLLRLLSVPRWLSLAAALPALLLDVLENSAHALLLVRIADRPLALSSCASHLTRLKWLAYTAQLCAVLAAALTTLTTALLGRRSEKEEEDEAS